MHETAQQQRRNRSRSAHRLAAIAATGIAEPAVSPVPAAFTLQALVGLQALIASRGAIRAIVKLLPRPKNLHCCRYTLPFKHLHYLAV